MVQFGNFFVGSYFKNWTSLMRNIRSVWVGLDLEWNMLKQNLQLLCTEAIKTGVRYF